MAHSCSAVVRAVTSPCLHKALSEVEPGEQRRPRLLSWVRNCRDDGIGDVCYHGHMSMAQDSG